MNQAPTDVSQWNAARTHDLVRLAAWTGAWLATLAVAAFGPELVWDSGTATLIAIAVNLAIGVGVIRANILHVGMLDEMMQRIHLEAMALALGIGVVGGLGYSLVETNGLIAGDAEIAVAVMVALIAITYLGALVVGCRRRG